MKRLAVTMRQGTRPLLDFRTASLRGNRKRKGRGGVRESAGAGRITEHDPERDRAAVIGPRARRARPRAALRPDGAPRPPRPTDCD